MLSSHRWFHEPDAMWTVVEKNQIPDIILLTYKTLTLYSSFYNSSILEYLADTISAWILKFDF